MLWSIPPTWLLITFIIFPTNCSIWASTLCIVSTWCLFIIPFDLLTYSKNLLVTWQKFHQNFFQWGPFLLEFSLLRKLNFLPCWLIITINIRLSCLHIYGLNFFNSIFFAIKVIVECYSPQNVQLHNCTWLTAAC